MFLDSRKEIKILDRKFYIGLIFFTVSYLQFLLPSELVNFKNLTILNLAFMLGIIYICEGITLKLKNQSIHHEIRKNTKNLIAFVVVSTAGGILLDGIAKWLGKLWIYPYWDFYTYLFLFIPGFAIYWLMIVESYLATKAIIDYFHGGRQIVGKSFGFEKYLYKFLGIVGIGFITISIIFIASNWYQDGGYIADLRDVSSITENFKTNFSYLIFLFLGLWFSLEFIEYSRKKTSLIKDIAHHYFSPLTSILIGSLLLAIIMETQNAPLGYWIYTNWPLQNFQLFGLPILMYFAWPLHYILFLSLFRAFTQKESDEIWRGDLIK